MLSIIVQTGVMPKVVILTVVMCVIMLSVIVLTVPLC
jgi:hypothetical protein